MINEYFQRSPMLRTGSLVVVILVLIGCAFGVWNAFSAPTEQQEQVTRIAYSQESAFGYTAQLIDNALYGPITLTEKNASSLFLSIVDNIEGSFSYSLTANQPLEQLSHKVEIVAVLKNSDNWSKTIVLVPEIVETAAFTVSFPLDTSQFFELIDTIEEQIEVRGSAYDLTIQANIHTTAMTEYGPINESLAPSMTGTLQPARIAWPSEPPLSQTQHGSLQETIVVPIERGNSRILWAIALGFAMLLSLFIAWSYIHFRPIPLTAVEAEAQRVLKKHGDVITNVEELPKVIATDMVSPVSSLDDLFNTADFLLKPVLHKAEPGKHTYQVIDGFTTYEYVSQEQPTPEENEG